MAEHVAAVVGSGGYGLQPHAVVVTNSALQSNLAGQAAGAPQNASQATQPEQSSLPSWVLPLAVGTGAVAVFGGALYAADYFSRRDANTVKSALCCYRDTAELMSEGQCIYTEATLRKALTSVFMEGKNSRRRTLAERLAEARSKGLSAKKMVRLLNLQAQTLAKGCNQCPAEIQQAYRRSFLRPFAAHSLGDRELSSIAAEELFDCEDVKRFALLYAVKGQHARKAASENRAGHFVMCAHDPDDKSWRIYDKAAKNERSAPLCKGEPTREDAKRALQAFAQSTYGRTHNVNLTLISQKNEYIPLAK